MDENKIKAWGYCESRVLLGVAAIVGACKTPQAISDYAINVKSEQIVNNTIKSVTSIIATFKNENNISIHNYKEKLQKSMNDPVEFKKKIESITTPVLKELGLKKTRGRFSSDLDRAKTKEDILNIVHDQLPDVLLDSEGKPFVLDESTMERK